ncbi:MAG TPA: ABC transporter permease [Planctomycetia bacterium]|nr:ABC transporter permease [Planctomycetia bacterium]
MRKIWTIARREYLSTVRTKAFLVGVFLMPIMMGASTVITIVMKRIEDQGEKIFAIVDRTPGEKLFPVLQSGIDRRNAEDVFDKKTGERDSPLFKLEKIAPAGSDQDSIDKQRLELSDRVRKGQIAGFLEIGPKAMDEQFSFASIMKAAGLGGSKGSKNEKKPDAKEDPAATRYQSRPTIQGSMEFYRWAMMQVVLATKFGAQAAADPKIREQMQNQKAPVLMLGLSSRDSKTGKIVDDEGASKTMAGIFVGFGLVMLMFMLIMVVATPLMQSVLEEKMQKISEVLLGSVTPLQLMFGKLAGGIAVALTLAAIYMGGAVWGVRKFDLSDQIPPSLVLWFLFYAAMALVMYGSMFMAIGAACNDLKEPQTLAMPVMLCSMLPMFFLTVVIREPDGMISRGISFFPPSTPMLMIARQAVSANIQWWEPLVGSLGIAIFTIFCVWAGSRIFRVGILMQGKAPSFGQLIKWIFTG